MAEGGVQRRLAAIVIADLVGYSRHMERDPTGTRERFLAIQKELVEAILAEHQGRIVNVMGDAFLIEFGSAVVAVKAVVEFQRRLAEQEAARKPDEQIQFRIGVNLGDIIVEGDDIHGEGVNIAARLEALAEPGGITVSGRVYEQLHDDVDVGYEFMGEQQVKNVERLVRAYKVLLDPADAGKAPTVAKPSQRPRWQTVAAMAALLILILAGGGAWWWSQQPDFEPADPKKFAHKLPDKPSIAVLPFDYLGADKEENEYLADGFSENVIANLAQIPSLLVIARNSTFVYKNRPVDVRNVAEELGIRYVLEGSIQRSADRIRVTAQLVDAVDGKHRWAETYDRKIDQYFDLQDELTKKIVVALQGELFEGEGVYTRADTTQNLQAWKLYTHSLAAFQTYTPEGFDEAQNLAEQATAIDPKFGAAMLMQSWVDFARGRFFISKDPEQSIFMAMEKAERVVEISPDFADGLSNLGMLDSWRDEHDRGIERAERAQKMAPNSGVVNLILGQTYIYGGQPEKAIAALQRAKRLQAKFNSSTAWHTIFALADAGRFEECLRQIDYYESLRNPSKITLMYRIISLAKLNRLDEARKATQSFVKKYPKSTVRSVFHPIYQPYKDDWAYKNYSVLLTGLGVPDEAPEVKTTKPAIAVLPFANLSDDKDQEYFADGMTDDLITDLSKVSGLIVIARNSVFTYKGKNVKVQEVAKDLNVTHVLEGSVRPIGNKIRINAQLIDAKTGDHLWADRFDGPIDNLFALQDSVMRKIVSAMSQNIELPTRHDNNGKIDPEALKLFWSARSDLHKLRGSQIGRLGLPIKTKLRRALELDADNPDIMATLGWLHFVGSRAGRTATSEFTSTRARQLAAQSLQIRETGLALMLKAALLFEDEGRPDDAIKLGRKALTLAPNDLLNLEVLASMLLRNGEIGEALEHLLQVRRLDPLGTLGQEGMGLGLALFLSGKPEAALPILKKQSQSGTLGLIPIEYYYQTAALSAAGRHDEAKALTDAYIARCRSPDFQKKYHNMAWCYLLAFKNALLYTFKFQHEETIAPLLSELRKTGFPEEPE